MVYNFEKIYSDYYTNVLNYVSSRVDTIELAEEMTNDVFIKVYNKIDKYDPLQGKFTTWLFTIVKNHIIDQYRKMKLGVNSLDIDDGFDLNSESPIPDEIMENYDLKRKITNAVRKLPKPLKECFVSRFYFDLQYNEIAKKLNIPIGTVKGNIHRAKEILKENLTDKKVLI